MSLSCWNIILFATVIFVVFHINYVSTMHSVVNGVSNNKRLGASTHPPTIVPIKSGRMDLSNVFDFSRRQWATKLVERLQKQEDILLENVTSRLSWNFGYDKPRKVQNLVSKRHLMEKSVSSLNGKQNWSQKNIVRFPEQQILGGVVSVGMYYIELDVGCGQIIHVQVDTGSSTMAVPLSECVNCKQHDRRYDFSKCPNATRGEKIPCDSDICGANTCYSSYCGSCSASTAACCSQVDNSKCGFILRYGDGAFAQGTVIHETVTIANITFKTYFGGILKDSPSFELTEVDGVFGLAFPLLACNPTCLTPVFDDMVQKGLVERDIFSIHSDLENGVLVLGGSDDRLYDGTLEYSPLINANEPEFYEVECEEVTVSGTNVDLPHFKTAVVDSGTTLIILSLDSFLALKRYFQAHYCNVSGLCGEDGDPDLSWFDPDYCALLEDSEIRQLPNIEFHLKNDVLLILEPEDYMLKVESPNLLTGEIEIYRCLGIHYMQHLERMGNDMILGGTLLQRYYTVYDREQMRLGFAKAKRWSDVKQVLDETRQPEKGTDNVEASQPSQSPFASTSPTPRTNEEQGELSHSSSFLDILSSYRLWIVVGASIVGAFAILSVVGIILYRRRRNRYAHVDEAEAASLTSTGRNDQDDIQLSTEESSSLMPGTRA
ncbi:aspartyl protease [Galdieria sulphuraria]|uniref:Aspartyl protease n=1 Tax=Galdieria sulphuraria TaxID=130081 RepID=M2XNY8_GALSU|nr:aspartyl protease [Galdieria sulphuraria]EME31867.1 aspartyl protease [Galdieria sulphuraria]|eukprot:XP_005708387.1 aspartyl protease [Galdieria sulphuraria]